MKVDLNVSTADWWNGLCQVIVTRALLRAAAGLVSTLVFQWPQSVNATMVTPENPKTEPGALATSIANSLRLPLSQRR
jgi:hypothetical protein